MKIPHERLVMTRRGALATLGSVGLAIATTPLLEAHAGTIGDMQMTTFTTRDGTEIFYKDWGSGQPIVFSHGWPLSADAWDSQMLFLPSRAIG